MKPESSHIAVCLCTYKRPQMLKRLLDDLSDQETHGAFTFSIVVADNDQSQSAEAVVSAFATRSSVPVTYCVEPRQGICFARNRAIEHATGNFVAFIDDDEFPARCWLLELFRACSADGVDGVLGPVLRHFDETPPQWLIKGNFYKRPRHSTGFVIHWREGRTGNVLLKRRVFEPDEPPFDPNFHRGGDVDFFRRMTEKGRIFIWCDEAVVYEVVPPVRWTRSFMLKRAKQHWKINGRCTGLCLCPAVCVRARTTPFHGSAHPALRSHRQTLGTDGLQTPKERIRNRLTNRHGSSSNIN
jgi:glycosyltransferase involved in cell wall biosynthesis